MLPNIPWAGTFSDLPKHMDSGSGEREKVKEQDKVMQLLSKESLGKS